MTTTLIIKGCVGFNCISSNNSQKNPCSGQRNLTWVDRPISVGRKRKNNSWARCLLRPDGRSSFCLCFKDANYCRYMCIKLFVKHYISLNKQKVSYLSDLFLPHSRRPSAMFTHPGARFCHTYTRQEGRVARSGHSWSDL